MAENSTRCFTQGIYKLANPILIADLFPKAVYYTDLTSLFIERLCEISKVVFRSEILPGLGIAKRFTIISMFSTRLVVEPGFVCGQTKRSRLTQLKADLLLLRSLTFYYCNACTYTYVPISGGAVGRVSDRQTRLY